MKPISATDNSIPPWYNQSEATPILSAITSFAKGLGHAWKLGVSEATYEHQADGNGAAFMPY